MSRDGRGDPADLGLRRPPHASQAPISAGPTPNDQFGHQVVVVLADGVTGLVAGVEADARTRRGVETWSACRATGEPTAAWVLGIDPHLNGVTVFSGRRPGRRRRASSHRRRCGSARPPGPAPSPFRDRVLLETGVHLQKVDFHRPGEELNGPGVVVATGFGHLDSSSYAHGPADVVGEVGSGAFLHQLLMPALGRAVPAGPATACCRGRSSTCISTWQGPSGSARRRSPAGRMSLGLRGRLISMASAAASALSTTFMPRQAALMARGHPTSSPKATTSSGEVSGSERRHPGDTRFLGGEIRELILSPMTSMPTRAGGAPRTSPRDR